MRAVKELDYVANAHARALAGTPNKSIAIVLNSVISPHYAHVAQGVEAQAATVGRLCLIGTTGGDPDRELAMVQFMREQHAEAVILVGNVVADDKYRERMSRVRTVPGRDRLPAGAVRAPAARPGRARDRGGVRPFRRRVRGYQPPAVGRARADPVPRPAQPATPPPKAGWPDTGGRSPRTAWRTIRRWRWRAGWSGTRATG